MAVSYLISGLATWTSKRHERVLNGSSLACLDELPGVWQRGRERGMSAQLTEAQYSVLSKALRVVVSCRTSTIQEGRSLQLEMEFRDSVAWVSDAPNSKP